MSGTAREDDYFDGAALPEADNFEMFRRAAVTSDACDMRFVHAHASTSRAPLGGLVPGDTQFGPGKHCLEVIFAKSIASMKSVESVTLGDAVYAPDYCLVFSPTHGLYRPTAGVFDITEGGPSALVKAYGAFEIADNGSLAIRRLGSLEYHDEIGIPICGMGLPNYGHFLFDGLSLAAFMAERLRSDGARLIGQRLQGWQMDVIRALGLEDLYLPLRGPHRFRTIVASNLLMGHVSYPTRFARLAFDLIRLRLGVAPGARNRRLFILRPNKPGRRYLVNQAEVVACAQEHDFDIIQPELLSFNEQVRTFAAASVVAGEAGAAMANIGFCDPGTQVLEIMPEDFGGAWIRGACLILSHQWHVYFARMIEHAPEGTTDHHRLNFRYAIDIDPLHEALRHICRGAAGGRVHEAPPFSPPTLEAAVAKAADPP